MTLILELPDNKEAALKAKAQALGVSAEQYAEQVLTRELEEQSEPFWKAFTRQIILHARPKESSSKFLPL